MIQSQATPLVASSLCTLVDRKMFLISQDAHLKVLALSVEIRPGGPRLATNL